MGESLFSFVLIVVPLGARVVGRRLGAIATVVRATSDGLLPFALETQIHDPILGTAIQTITALLLGIVFLMTNKPPLISSILTIGIALVLGGASGLPLARANRTRNCHSRSAQENVVSASVEH